MIKKIFQLVLRHKTIGALIIVIIGGGLYYGWKTFSNKSDAVRYTLAAAEKGTIIVSVSGTGQISASDQIDIKPKVSGEVEEIFIASDQKVKAGELLVKLKTKDFQEAIDDATSALNDVQVNLEKLETDKQTYQQNLDNNYKNAVGSISDAFNALTQIMPTLESIFVSSSFNGTQADIDYYRNTAAFFINKGSFSESENEEKESFLAAKEKYETIRREYFSSQFSSPSLIESWLQKTYDLVKEIADLSRSGRDIIAFYQEVISTENLTPSISLSVTQKQLSDLSSITSSLDQKASDLLSYSQNLDDLKNQIFATDNSIESQKVTIRQKANVLEQARED